MDAEGTGGEEGDLVEDVYLGIRSVAGDEERLLGWVDLVAARK